MAEGYTHTLLKRATNDQYEITVTPISRLVVKGTNNFFGGADRQWLSFRSLQRQRSNRARFFGLWLRTNDGSRQTPIRIKRRPNDGLRLGGMAAPEERWYRPASKRSSQNHGCRRAGANLRMAYGAGDPLSRPLVTAIRRPIQCSWLQPQSPYLARRIVVVPQAKQRVTSNGLPSFRM
jgi:hypothetical protein